MKCVCVTMKFYYQILALLVIGAQLAKAKTLCQKILDGEESNDVSVEEINRCHECQGWYRINGVDAEDNDGRSWCATPGNDVFKVAFQRPIKIAGFTVRSAYPHTSANITVLYEDDQKVFANARDSNGDIEFPRNTDDYTVKKNTFLVPITTEALRIHIYAYESQPCFDIQLYSCDKQNFHSPGYARNIAFSDAGSHQTSEDSTECLIDVKTDCREANRCLQHRKGANGCDVCDCDVFYTGMKEGDIIVDGQSREMVEIAYGIRKDPYNVMRGGLKGDQNRWNDYRSGNNYIVPYVFEESLSSTARRVIPDAMAAIESATCMRFRQKTNQEYYLRFFRGQGCYSYVGNIRREGGQQISIGSGCEHTGVVQHEILHALGFWHEQSRSDRDKYVRILYQNIQRGRENNFEKRESEDFGSPYDYKSVMHYGNKAFSANGEDTIRAIGNPSLSLGQRDGLSKEDIIQVNRMYKCTSRPTAKPRTTRPTTPTPPTPPTTNKPTTCSDKQAIWACEYWKSRGYCTNTFASYMKKQCAKTCGKCKSRCKDRRRSCPRIKRRCRSKKAKRRAKMLKTCPKTCGVC